MEREKEGGGEGEFVCVGEGWDTDSFFEVFEVYEPRCLGGGVVFLKPAAFMIRVWEKQ